MPKRPRRLDGLRVLVTRPVGRERALIDGLERLGASVIHIPTILIAPPRSWAPVDRAIGRLSDYDWVLFTSAQGAQAFYGRLGRRPQPVPVAVVGPVTAEGVRRAGGKVRKVAREHRAEALAPALGKVAGKRILIPSAEKAGPELPLLLRQAGARVDVVAAYRTLKNKAAAQRLAAAQRAGVDIAIFTSSSTAENLALLIGKARLRRMFRTTRAASIGPVTTATLRKLGVEPAFKARTYTAKGLLEAISHS